MAQEPTDPPAVRRRPGSTETSPSRPLHDMAALLGGRVWLERRLFESLGRWSCDAGDAGDTAAKLHLADASRRHGWHAQVWTERMPELSGFDVESLVVAPDDRLIEVFDVLDGADSVAARLDGHCRVLLPRMIVAYRATIGGLGAAADASVQRWSRLVLVDDLDEWERGESILQGLVRDESRLDAVGETRRRLELLLLGAPLLAT